MKYKAKYNIRVRKEPSIKAEQKWYRELNDNTKPHCKAFMGEALIEINEIINIKKLIESDGYIFGKLQDDEYVCLSDGTTKFAVLLRENTNEKARAQKKKKTE
jgi:hypothetical protein